MRVTQQGRWMIGNYERHTFVSMNLTPKAPETFLHTQQRLCGERAESNDYFRLYESYLPAQEWRTLLDFIRLRITISGRPTLQHITDVNFLSR